MTTLIIAEIGNNHNGSIERAERLIRAAKAAGAHVAKFQMRSNSSLYRNSPNSIEDLGVEYTRDILSKYELKVDDHKQLKDICDAVGIEYMCTPWDQESLMLLEDMGVKRYKLASADFENNELIKKVIETGKQIILSTGMATRATIEKQSQFINAYTQNYWLLHCNSTYPAPFDDIELNFLKTLKGIHPNIGYSGHERGISVSLAAVALGAEIVERHLTEDRNLEGPDHQASLLPDELMDLCTKITEIERALGPSQICERKLSQGTLLNKEILGKSLVVARTIKSGSILKENDILVRSPGQGISPNRLHEFVGKKLTVTKNCNDFLFESDFTAITTKLKEMPSFPNWGIPVRNHDHTILHEKFNAPVYEFHVSYKDLNRKYNYSKSQFLKHKKIVVHAPELFSDSRLLNLCERDEAELEISRLNLQSVLNFSEKIVLEVGYNSKIQVVANVGGFSVHDFLDTHERQNLYERVHDSLVAVQSENTEVIIQNMAPFPWHFGGQRFQNIFLDPNEIVTFCEKYGYRICLDTAHLSMYCKYFEKNFTQEFSKLLPVTAHIHMSDAKGLNGEGVQTGSGDVPFEHVMNNLPKEISFIVETWQGHKEYGKGFETDLAYLRSVEK